VTCSARRAGAVLALAWLASGCAAVPGYDHAPFRAHLPRSILILPPLSEATDVNAPYVFLSTVTRPVAEAGYYVFPVAVVDALMKENGLPTPGEMHQVSLSKLREVFGADAVLYVTVEDWGQRYRVLDSSTIVRAHAALVDTASGETIWDGRIEAVESSAAGQSDVVGMLITALIEQVVDNLSDRTHEVSRLSIGQTIFDQQRGFLRGPRHPEYDADVRGR
jgi:hypothetical protein